MAETLLMKFANIFLWILWENFLSDFDQIEVMTENLSSKQFNNKLITDLLNSTPHFFCPIVYDLQQILQVVNYTWPKNSSKYVTP